MSENNRELVAIATKHANNRSEISIVPTSSFPLTTTRNAPSTFQEKCRSNNLRVMKTETARNLRETICEAIMGVDCSKESSLFHNISFNLPLHDFILFREFYSVLSRSVLSFKYNYTYRKKKKKKNIKLQKFYLILRNYRPTQTNSFGLEERKESLNPFESNTSLNPEIIFNHPISCKTSKRFVLESNVLETGP